MRKLIFILAIPAIFLTSCEGFIRISGYAYDEATKKPIENAEVILILNKRDTIESNRLEYDTIPYEDRKALRKQGIRDDYAFHDTRGLSKFIPCLTDTIGKFQIGNMLVGCVPRCPTTKVLLKKNGYKPIVVEVGSIVRDSLQVFMEADH